MPFEKLPISGSDWYQFPKIAVPGGAWHLEVLDEVEDGDPDAHQPPAEGFVPGLARLQPELGSINTFRNFRAGISHISI